MPRGIREMVIPSLLEVDVELLVVEEVVMVELLVEKVEVVVDDGMVDIAGWEIDWAPPLLLPLPPPLRSGV